MTTIIIIMKSHLSKTMFKPKNKKKRSMIHLLKLFRNRTKLALKQKLRHKKTYKRVNLKIILLQ